MIYMSEGTLHRMEKELRTTKRALWIARAERAKAESIVCDLYNEYNEKHLWNFIEGKCREKAEQYR